MFDVWRMMCGFRLWPNCAPLADQAAATVLVDIAGGAVSKERGNDGDANYNNTRCRYEVACT